MSSKSTSPARKGEICQYCNCPKNSKMLTKEVSDLKQSSSPECHESVIKKEEQPDFEKLKRTASSSSKNKNCILNTSKNNESHQPSQESKQENQKKIPSQVCPMCVGVFQHLSFNDFQYHVESHFLTINEFDSIEDYDLLAKAENY